MSDSELELISSTDSDGVDVVDVDPELEAGPPDADNAPAADSRFYRHPSGLIVECLPDWFYGRNMHLRLKKKGQIHLPNTLAADRAGASGYKDARDIIETVHVMACGHASDPLDEMEVVVGDTAQVFNMARFPFCVAGGRSDCCFVHRPAFSVRAPMPLNAASRVSASDVEKLIAVPTLTSHPLVTEEVTQAKGCHAYVQVIDIRPRHSEAGVELVDTKETQRQSVTAIVLSTGNGGMHGSTRRWIPSPVRPGDIVEVMADGNAVTQNAKLRQVAFVLLTKIALRFHNIPQKDLDRALADEMA